MLNLGEMMLNLMFWMIVQSEILLSDIVVCFEVKYCAVVQPESNVKSIDFMSVFCIPNNLNELIANSLCEWMM